MKAVLPESFVKTDGSLLEKAYDLLPRIPTDNLDLLIIDDFGLKPLQSPQDEDLHAVLAIEDFPPR